MSECRHNLGKGIMCIRCTNEAAAREREERLKKRVAELESHTTDTNCPRCGCDVTIETDTIVQSAIVERDALAKRAAELEAAIRKHHQNVWGDSNVKHPEDVELYATLEGEK